MVSVYILRSLKSNRFYVGSSKNIEQRFNEHSQGQVKATKNMRPLELVFSQAFDSGTMARQIEYKLKSFKRKDILERIISEGAIRLKI